MFLLLLLQTIVQKAAFLWGDNPSKELLITLGQNSVVLNQAAYKDTVIVEATDDIEGSSTKSPEGTTNMFADSSTRTQQAIGGLSGI